MSKKFKEHPKGVVVLEALSVTMIPLIPAPDEGLQRQVEPPKRRMSFEEYRNRPLPMRFNHRVPAGGQHDR